MENIDLHIAMGMKSKHKGVQVRRVEPTAPTTKFLRSSYILLSYDGIDIANDGIGKENSLSISLCLLDY